MAVSSKTAWKKWYKENKGEYNAARKAKRDADPALREQIAAKQRVRRANTPRPDSDQPRFKIVNKKQVEVFRIGVAAKACHRTEQVLRIWERDKKIPKPSVPGGHRYYTQNQINMLAEFAELMDEVRYDPSVRAVAIEKKSADLFANWNNV